MSDKKQRIDLTIHEDSDASGKFFTIVSSITDKQSGTARVLKSASAKDLKQAIYWCKQYTQKDPSMKGIALRFVVKDKPKKEKKEKKVAPPPPSFSTEETFDQPSKKPAWN